MILKNIGSYEDITINRLMKDIEFSSYDKDSPVMLRKIIQKVIMIPFIGKLFVIIFKNFFILQTISRKEL